jgi:hypothetical protein
MINYKNLDESVNFYSKQGFQRIESPWTITKSISGITKPPSSMEFEIIGKNKVLVASGEQSFLYLYLKGFLPKGRFQTITPCFRDEIFDEVHTKYFMKNELIVTDEVTHNVLGSVLTQCFNFFKKMLDGDQDLKIVQKTKDSYDIEYKGIELGSYGIRRCNYLHWIYGTGCAEPRLSYCQNIKLYGVSSDTN